MILHITTRAAWDEARARGTYRGDSLASEGFIHFSAPHQVLRTARRFFAGVPDLVLLAVDPTPLGAALRWEDPGEGEAFPHLYSPLDPAAVSAAHPFAPGPDGEFQLPPELEGLVGG